MALTLHINGSVNRRGQLRHAFYNYVAEETSPGMWKVRYFADYVTNDDWTEIPFDRLFLDINNHVMQYAQKMRE